MQSTHSQSTPSTQPQSHTPRVHAGALLKTGHAGNKEGLINPRVSPSPNETKHINIFLHDISISNHWRFNNSILITYIYIDMIKNPDGTPYNVAGSLQQFDPENPEHDLFNVWDDEAIKIGGSPIFYYEVFIQEQTVDPIYLEDRGKIYSNCPVKLWAVYEPITSQNYMNAFGFDSPDEMLFELNYRDVLNTLGHPPKIGARLYSPHKRENWKIVQRNVEEFKLWGELRLQLLSQRFQESRTTGEGKVTQKEPDFKMNSTTLNKPMPGDPINTNNSNNDEASVKNE